MRVLFFVLFTAALFQVAIRLPLVGPIVRSLPILGLLGCVMLAAAGASWAERTLAERRRAAAELRDLGAVDTPNARGKLGTALLARKKFAEALEHLEAAREGEPETIEWAYRTSQALRGLGRREEALVALEDAVRADEEYAYGAAMLELSELRLELGDAEGAWAAAERAARNHGPSPESGYRRGEALRQLGRTDEARAAFDEAVELARTVPGFQKGEARRWGNKARRARV